MIHETIRNGTKQESTNLVCSASCHFVWLRGSLLLSCPNLMCFDLGGPAELGDQLAAKGRLKTEPTGSGAQGRGSEKARAASALIERGKQ